MAFASRLAALAGAAALAVQPALAAAQQTPCITEEEVSAIGIYSVPSLLETLRLRCGGELSPGGYLARDGNALISRYAALQDRAWPVARSGLTKVLAGKSAEASSALGVIARLPDESVRPLIDALIVQELSPKIALKDCWKIERVVEAVAPIDPEIAGTLLGTVVGVTQPDQIPVCRARGQ